MLLTVLLCLVACLHASSGSDPDVESLLSGSPELAALTPRYARARAAAHSRRISHAHSTQPSLEWARATPPPLTLMQEDEEALNKATPGKADEISGPYTYANATKAIERLIKICTRSSVEKVLNQTPDLLKLIAGYAGAHATTQLRRASSIQYAQLSPGWVQTTFPTLTLTEEDVEALMQATPEEADVILGPYTYENATEVIGRLAELFFSDRKCRATYPNLPEVLAKLGQHGGRLDQKFSRKNTEIFIDHLEDHPDQGLAFVQLIRGGFLGDLWESRHLLPGNLSTRLITLLSPEALEEALQNPEFLDWIKKAGFSSHYDDHWIDGERAKVLVNAIGFKRNSEYYYPMLTRLLEDCDAEHALVYVKVFLAHSASQQSGDRGFYSDALWRLTEIEDFPLEAFRLLLEAGASMTKIHFSLLGLISAFEMGLCYCADPVGLIECALEHGIMAHLSDCRDGCLRAINALLRNSNATPAACIRLIRLCACSEPLSSIVNSAYCYGIQGTIGDRFQARFDLSVEAALQAAEQAEGAKQGSSSV